jgi:hypothetical protein
MIGRSLALLAVALVCAASAPAQAQQEYYGPRSEYSPSVFTYGYRGLTVGALGGLSGGYLVARHDGFQGRDWRPLVLGAGIGALSGAALGLGLGFADLADDRPGMGNIALRDMAYGGGFGAIVGLIVGGLVVIKTHDAEHVPFGAAVGALSGIGIGLVVGLIEGRRIVNSPAHRYSGKGLAPALFAVEDVRDRLAWSAGARGSF